MKNRYIYYIFSSYIKSFLFYKKFGFKSIVLHPIDIIGKDYISIGKGCFIYKHARIEAVSEYMQTLYSPKIEIGDKVYIQQNFHCTCANLVKIGDGTSITPNVGIFDIIHPYENVYVNPREQSIRTKPVIIGKNCLIGMNSVILPGTILGEHCVVGANSVVSGVFDDFSILAGAPAKVVKKYDNKKAEWICIKS